MNGGHGLSEYSGRSCSARAESAITAAFSRTAKTMLSRSQVLARLGSLQTEASRCWPVVIEHAAAWHGPTQGFFWSKLLFFFVVGVVFGTIAYHTKSIQPALPVHIAGDVLFFVVIWPQEAGRPVVWREGIGAGCWLEVLQLIVFGAAAVLAFRRLRTITRSQLPLAHSMPAAS
jgi:hypothetical protein